MERLARVRPDSARRWGRMTAHQMICHLADAKRMALGERTGTARSGILQRTVMKWGAIYVPLPWPHGLPTTPEADQERDGTRPVEFDRDMAELVHFIERFFERDREYGRHPVFGPMTWPQWMRWGWLHVDHHCRQFGA